jgi:hypothetical protein
MLAEVSIAHCGHLFSLALLMVAGKIEISIPEGS